MQSSSVVRGSISSLWSLPLMRSVIGTAPVTADPSTVRVSSLSWAKACAGVCTANTPAASVPVKRNWRRFGCDDSGRLLLSSIVVDLTRSLFTPYELLRQSSSDVIEQSSVMHQFLPGDYLTQLPS